MSILLLASQLNKSQCDFRQNIWYGIVYSHLKKLGLHSTCPHESGSSDLSRQSAFPSQYHDLGMQMPDFSHLRTDGATREGGGSRLGRWHQNTKSASGPLAGSVYNTRLPTHLYTLNIGRYLLVCWYSALLELLIGVAAVGVSTKLHCLSGSQLPVSVLT